jgi:hypothetical protein
MNEHIMRFQSVQRLTRFRVFIPRLRICLLFGIFIFLSFSQFAKPVTAVTGDLSVGITLGGEICSTNTFLQIDPAASGKLRCANFEEAFSSNSPTFSSLNVTGEIVFNPVVQGLIAYWNMDELLGDIVDHQGAHTATNSNTSATDGKINSARSFGSSVYLAVADGLDFVSNYESISAWIYATSFNTGAVFNRRSAANVGGVSMELSAAGNINCRYYISGAWRQAAAAITQNAWNHVVCSYDGTSVKTYVNGVLLTTTAISGTMNNPSSPLLYIGRNVADGAYFNGAIDELGIWKRALTAAEVTNLYNSTRGYQLRNNAYVIDTSGGSGRVQASMYLGTLGMRWYRDPNSSYLYQYSADNAVTGTQYLLNTGASTGFVYGKNTGTDTGFGLLTNGGAWALRIPMSGTVIDIPGDVRTPRFYDYNNTNYYVDPATTSVTDVTEATQICLNGDCRTVWPGQ